MAIFGVMIVEQVFHNEGDLSVPLAEGQQLRNTQIDAAKSVHFDYLNTQGQPKLVWPPTFALVRAYVDQLERANDLEAPRISSIRQSLTAAEAASGAQRRAALTQLAMGLDGNATASRDAAKVRTVAASVRDLAAATP